MSVELSRGEWIVLGLLAEKPAHGWLLSRELAPDGAIGRIWSCDRQRVYRILHRLENAQLIEAILTEPGDGASRTVYSPTAEGRDRLTRWLSQPVQHMHEVPTTFLLKLVLGQRARLDTRPLVRAQLGIVTAAAESLALKVRQAPPRDRLYLRLRLETARAFLSFLEGLGEEATVLQESAASRQSRRSPRSGQRDRAKPGSHRHVRPTTRVSDFSGLPLDDESRSVTIILRFREAGGAIVVASAHVDDAVVAEIASVAHEASPRRAGRGR